MLFRLSFTFVFFCLLPSLASPRLGFPFWLYIFCRVHATLQPALSVRPSVGRSRFIFFYDFISLTSLLLPKWSSDLRYGPCPLARNFGSRVSGLVLFFSSHRHSPYHCQKHYQRSWWSLRVLKNTHLYSTTPICIQQHPSVLNNTHPHSTTHIRT